MKGKSIKFLLTGTYSSFNKGDAAMQLATAEALKRRWPDCEITISTPFPKFDAELYKSYSYSIVTSVRRRLIFATLLLVAAHFYSLLNKVGINFNFLISNQEVTAIKNAAVVVDLSGDTITEDYGPHVTYSHLLPLLIAQALNTPTYICAQSIGPFRITRWLTKRTLSRCSGISAREKVTFDYLKSLGIPSEKLVQESDMAFLLSPASHKTIKDIMKQEKIKPARPILGVTVSNIIRDRYNSKQGLGFESFFAGVMDKAVEDMGVDILFLGHVTGPSRDKDDRLIAESVIKHMKHRSNVFLLCGDYSPQELKGLISQCELFLGSRMHSNIGAVSTHVPTLALGYSHKTIGIMSSIGMKKYVLAGGELTEKGVYSALQQLSHSATEIRRKLEDTIPKIKKSSQQNIENISIIIDKGALGKDSL